MKIRILQLDPADPNRQDQISRMRQCYGTVTVDYFRHPHSEEHEGNWDWTILFTSEKKTDLPFTGPKTLLISPQPGTFRPCWQVCPHWPDEEEMIVRLISRLAQDASLLKRSLMLQWRQICKQKQLSRLLQAALKDRTVLPEQVWLFVCDRQDPGIEDDRQKRNLPVVMQLIRQKAEHHLVCLIDPLDPREKAS